MSQIGLIPFYRAVDTNGNPLPNARLYTFLTGTLTPQAVFTDETLDTSHGPYVQADANGLFPSFYPDPALVYRYQLRVSPYSAAVTGCDADPVSALSSGSITFLQSGTGAQGRTVQDKLRESVSVEDFGAVGDGVTDDTAAIQAALDAHDNVNMSGIYKISDTLLPNDGQTIIMSPETLITQANTNAFIFYALAKDNLTFLCNGAVLYGYGVWSALWAGNGGHYDEAMRFEGCNNVLVDKVHTKNCGHAGITIIGGSSCRILYPVIEGTNLHSTPIPAEANFQIGIFPVHDLVAPDGYGTVEGLEVVGARITGVAQGVVTEVNSGASPQPVRAMVFTDTHFHDITGQHGFYLQSGNVNLIGVTASDVHLSVVKIQTYDLDISDLSVHNVLAVDCGGNLIEAVTAQDGTGSIRNVVAQGHGKNVNRLLSTARNIHDLVANVSGEDIPSGAVQIGAGTELSGSTMSDIDVTVSASDIGADGVLITAIDATGIRLHQPVIRKPRQNLANTEASGIRVASVSANVEIFDPDITDVDGNMANGIRNQTTGSIVKIYGRVIATGSTGEAIRADAKITEFPTTATLSGTAGAFNNQALVSSSVPMVLSARSTSSSPITVWTQTIDDESVYLVEASVVGKLSGSAQRAGYVLAGLFYRDGGSATQQGTTNSAGGSIASGSFLGVLAFAVSGNNVILQANSGGTANYDWTARVTVTKFVG